MVRLILLLLVWLGACSTPGPYFRDLPATRVTVAGSAFDVRVRGELAEALRVNPQYAPRLGPLPVRARFAMAQVSGCEVVRVLGDQAQMTGELSCGGRPPDWSRQPVRASYSCVQLSTWLDDEPGAPYYDYDCDPY
ncbi:hypothetical protein [Sedimentitalea todarodis]|uniref:Lipoprotein n=1 Tax=Sedimentitalea todarodis TaxID=1631240 RepID=A0ABU3V9H9_9RHOB|nr:hypothetical protein [Sedimentitalea todarodis]MDU9002821.1 hypothetical protein [Sedimentitalea todarodis]